MKFLKLSLAASLAVAALSSAANAASLENAIKGVDVSGHLRYRFNEDNYKDQGFVKDAKPTNGTHQFRAALNLKTKIDETVALTAGFLYHNTNIEGNRSVIPGSTGGVTTNSAFGAGADGGGSKTSDGVFGNSQFYATITPSSTKTIINVGKQPLDTPITKADDGDRGIGVLVLNSDTPLTIGVGAFDTWAIDDAGANTVDRALYALALIYGTDTGVGRIDGSLWGFMADKLVKSSVVFDVKWKSNFGLGVALQYYNTSLDNGTGNYFANYPAGVQNPAGAQKSNDLATLEASYDFRKAVNLPIDLKLGYTTNFGKGIAVAANDDAPNFLGVGSIWYQNGATKVSRGFLSPIVTTDQDQDFNLFYAAAGYSLLADKLRIGVDFVSGTNKIKSDTAADEKYNFTEITPNVSYQYNKQLKVSAFYAMLNTDNKSDGATSNATTTTKETRNRSRVEVRYNF